MADKRVTQVLN